METGGSPRPLPEYRVRARRLLDQLRSDSLQEAAAAATRFRRLGTLSTKTVDQILERRDVIKLKHALTVVALEHGFRSWRVLKASVEAGGRRMYAPTMDVFLNRWFVRYEDARASLDEGGGFLFPYERQFFVCGEGAVRSLGLDPRDPDWDRIGRDWAKPQDLEAWLRLKRKREEALFVEGPSAPEADA